MGKLSFLQCLDGNIEISLKPEKSPGILSGASFNLAYQNGGKSANTCYVVQSYLQE